MPKSHPRRSQLFVLLALAALLFVPPLGAASVPTGYQDFIVVGDETQVWEILRTVAVAEGQPDFDNGPGFLTAMNSVVTMTASADSQVVIYDHWEDGYEADPLNPVQATTLVLGDSNVANGRACDFTTDPQVSCGGLTPDALYQGTELTLNSDQGLPTCGAAPCIVRQPNPNPGGSCQAGIPASPADRRCSVPLPRDPSHIRFDGADRVLTSGGPISLVHNQDPMSAFIGGATEIIPREAVENAVSYTIPIGEDLYLGNNTATEPFKYVYLHLVAYDDNTSVSIDSPGVGVVNFTLNQGEHYSSLGYVEDVNIPAIAVVINAGTKVSTSDPIAGMIFTAGDGNFATRFDLLLPDVLHGTDYVTTAPGDDPVAFPEGEPTGNNRPLNLFIVNPDRFNAITVTTTDIVGTTNINIPAGEAVNYLTAAGRAVPGGSTVRLTSNRNFWGLSSYDHQGDSNDWGHSWIATKFLQQRYTVSFSPGVTNPAAQSLPAARLLIDADCTIPPAAENLCNTINRAPVYVAATQNNTRIQVDLNADGVFDMIDVNGDDFPDAANGTPNPTPAGWVVGPDTTTYVINSLRALRIYDYGDYDNTGTVVVANKPVALSWGQDTDQAMRSDPIPDTGYTVFQANLEAALTLEKVADPVTIPVSGGTVTYTLTLESGDVGALTVVSVTDLLPSGVVCADFVSGSSLVTYPNFAQDTADPVCAVDGVTGRSRLTWTFSPDTLDVNLRITVSYQIDIPAGPIAVLTNDAEGQGTLNGSVFRPTASADVTRTDAEITKSVVVASPGIAEPGVVLTYTLAVSNSGAAAETNVIILDAIPPDTTFVPGSIVVSGPFSGAYLNASNSVEFTAVSVGAGTGPFNLSFDVLINPTAEIGEIITNQANYASVQTPVLLSNIVETPISAPAITTSKSGTAGPLAPGQVVDFEIIVQNTGSATANNVTIIDPIPANATYLAESMTWRPGALPFTSVTDAADADEGTLLAGPARLQLAIGTLGAGAEATFRFRVVVNAGTSGEFLPNQATVTSDEVDPTDTNLYQEPIVGTNLLTGHVFLDLDGDGTQDLGEPDLANVDVEITDPLGNTLIVSTDAAGNWSVSVPDNDECYADTLPAVAYNGTTGDLNWSSTSWTEFSSVGAEADANVATDPLRIATAPVAGFGNSLRIIGAAGSPTRAFSRAADLSAFAAGNVRFNYLRNTAEAGDVLTVEADHNNDGTFESSLTTIVGATDAAWQSANLTMGGTLPANPVRIRFRWVANAADDQIFVDNVRLCDPGTVTANVQESDPDFPTGATLSTANDPQTLTLVVGGTTVTGNVGYEPVPLQITKTSDAGGEVFPGQIVTYTVTVTNQSGITQNNIDLDDILPPGATFVPASGAANLFTPGKQTFRTTDYVVTTADFGGTNFTLTLAQPLAQNYFVMIQGSADEGTNAPAAHYASVINDPFGTGDLGVSAASNQLDFFRSNAADDWRGVITVVECLEDCATDGFRLLHVQRVAHAAAGLSGGPIVSPVSWNAARIWLMSGHRGSGCETATATNSQFPSCQVRVFPTSTNEINWTRNGGGAANLAAATSVVSVIEWGTGWTVQHRNITGAANGAGVNAAAEYNTSAISSVVRADTWVWGAGHTADNGAGDGGNGIVFTLGDGAATNANETLLAAGGEFNDARSSQVWALTHPNLAVDYRFRADAAGASPINVTVNAATNAAMRFGLIYNSVNSTSNDQYPRVLMTSRHTSNTNVALTRAVDGSDFPGWVQGINLSGFLVAPSNTNLTGSLGAPPSLFTAASNVDMAPNAVLTVTYQVEIDPNLSLAITTIDNEASVTSVEVVTPISDNVIDDVVRLGVVVEYNNASFAEANAPAPQFLLFAHDVVNTGEVADSYTITLETEFNGWQLELLDPGTGAVIAIDSNGDGVWDVGGPVNTGTLLPGDRKQYDVRVRVPAGTPLGTQETVRMFATSDRNPALSDFSTDEIEVVDTSDIGPVVLLPDNSGVVNPDAAIAYAHYVVNNTGGNATFNLQATNVMNGAANPPGWSATIYGDTNFDGVYTPGVDLQITNSANLADGASQLFFVVVDSPPSALAGDTVVTVLTATQTTDPDVTNGASDTTTVILPASHDLAGGGTRLVQGGDIAIFPGTIFNQGTASDTFELSISPSAFFGLDGFTHPTHLYVDTNADGTPDTLMASDSDGDGDWDFILGGIGGINDPDADGLPQLVVPGDGQLAYELRRPTDINQTPYRDIVTLSAVSAGSGDMDSISAINLLAALTDAVIADFRAESAGRRVVLAWETASEVGTVGFDLYRRGVGASSWVKVNRDLIPGLLHAPQGGRYRFVDPVEARGPVAYQLVERVLDGTGRLLAAPLAVDPTVLRPAEGLVGDYEAEAHRGRPDRRSGVEPVSALRSLGGSVVGLRLKSRTEGLIRVTAAQIANGLGVSAPAIEAALANAGISLTRGGAQVAWMVDNGDLVYFSPPSTSIYSNDDVVQLRLGPGTIMPEPGAGGGALIFADGFETGDTSRWGGASGVVQPLFGGPPVDLRAAASAELDNFPVTAVATDPDGDFWHWEVFFAGGAAKNLTIATPAPTGTGTATLRVFFKGFSSTAAALDHRARVKVGATEVGVATWDGSAAHLASFGVPAGLVAEGTTTIQVVPELAPGVTTAIFYVDRIELDYDRRNEMVGGRIDARASNAGVLTVSNLGADALAFDLLELNLPRRLAIGNGLVDVPAGVDRLFVQNASAALAPAALEQDFASDLRSTANRANYLVIAGAGLEDPAQALADLRAQGGFEVKVVAIEDVYDEFSFGAVNPLAVQRLLAFAKVSWTLPPSHVALFGDGSFDYRDRFGANENLILSPMTATANGLVPSDQRLADWGNDGIPDVAIGRLPFRFVDQAEAYLATLTARASAAGTWRSTAVWVADDPDQGGEFPVDLDRVISAAGAGLTNLEVDRSRLAIDPARLALKDALDSGAALVAFLGHGGSDRLANEGLLKSSDVPGLTNGAKRPIFAAMTCNVGRSDFPGLETLAEELLLGTGGGAVALISPTGLQFNENGVEIAELYLGAQNGRTVGQALLKSLRDWIAAGGDPAVARLYVLTGDPAVPALPGGAP